MSSRKAPSARKDTVATAVQVDEPSRLVRVGKPSWEVLIDRLEYNMPAWNASNWIVKHNLKIIRHVQHIQDYETGKRSDPPPFSFAELLNPRTNAKSPSVKRNTGLDRLDYLFASLKRYEPGHAPAQNYEPVFISTRALLLLLKKCADVYGRRPEEQQLSRSLECVYAFQRFVEDTATLHLTRQEYDAKLDAMHERIAASFTENALLFETLCERRELARREKSPRKGTGRKGTRTAFMEKQLEEMKTFVLDGHPVDRRNRPATRAHQCWQLHRDEWDAHIRASGEAKGFAGYKPLGRAYRNA